RLTGCGRTAVTHGEHARNQSKTVALERAAKLGERQRKVSPGPARVCGEIGKQGELRRDIRKRRSRCLGGLEYGLLACGFDNVAGDAPETGKRRSGHRGAHE